MKAAALKDRISNTSIYDVVRCLFFGFFLYALIDVCWKAITHSQYDMERLARDIQEYYPDSELTFQNIKIVDTDFKVSSGRGSNSTYQETEYLYIRNGTLHEEPNFLIVLFLLPLVIVFSVFNIENPNIKLRDIPKMDPFTIGVLFVTFMSLVLPDDKYQFRRYKNPKAFIIDVEETRKEIQINDYRK